MPRSTGLAVLALLLAAFGAIPAGAAPVLEQAKARGHLTAAAVPDQEPVAARDAEGNLVGFDIDVARDLARRLGLPVTFVTPGWSAILSGDWMGQWDYCVCSITPTQARSERLSFPASYRFDAAVVVVRKDNTAIQTPAQASGKVVGVKADTTFEKYLKRDLVIFGDQKPIAYQIENATVRNFPDKDEAMAALVDGGVEAIVTSLLIARAAVDAGAEVRIVPGILFFEPVSVAVAKGDGAFATAVAEAVRAMHQDGTLTRLSQQWFGIDLSRILE